ncbi:hypothetical protein BJ165DRAFT_1535488 [Panaeolus papilionaceus]|nr:hypothetical protein BJ165DRAFT_1535488 [Panaeolus papilionaceus]
MQPNVFPHLAHYSDMHHDAIISASVGLPAVEILAPGRRQAHIADRLKDQERHGRIAFIQAHASVMWAYTRRESDDKFYWKVLLQAAQNQYMDAKRCILIPVYRVPSRGSRQFWDVDRSLRASLRGVHARSMLCGEHFTSLFPFAKLGSFDPSLCTINENGAFLWKTQGDSLLVGVLSGVVIECNVVPAASPDEKKQLTPKCIIIKPTYASFKGLQSFLYTVTKKTHLKTNLLAGSNLVFEISEHIALDALLGNYGPHKCPQTDRVSFNRQHHGSAVPLFDAARLGFRFGDSCFRGLFSLPLFRNMNETSRIANLPTYSVAAVFYTCRIEGGAILRLTCHAAIHLGGKVDYNYEPCNSPAV